VTILFEPKTGVTLTSEANTGLHARWFRAFLAQRGVVLRRGCAFDRSLATLDRFVQMMVTGHQPPMSLQEKFSLAADAIGTDFMTKAIHRTIAQTAEPFADFWPLFASGDPLQVRNGKQTMARDRVWELLVAALVADYSSNVIPDERPDIHCTYLGQRWGIACKSFHTTDRDRQVDAIVEAAKQLEKAPVDRGVVAVNLANVFPHMELFKINFPTSAEGIALVKRLQVQYMRRFENLHGSSRLALGDEGPRDKTRSVLFFCPTIINVDNRPALYCNVERLGFRQIRHEEERFALSFLKAAATSVGHPPPAS
jgi:hypothetical protein